MEILGQFNKGFIITRLGNLFYVMLSWIVKSGFESWTSFSNVTNVNVNRGYRDIKSTISYSTILYRYFYSRG